MTENSKLYNSWSSMKSRCDNPKHHAYHRYGGRGITYNNRWRTFHEFEKDMGEAYRPGLSLDRINNDKSYSKNNCRWATKEIQNNNRSDNVYYEHGGVKLTLPQWAKHIGIKRSTLSMRIYKYGWSIEDALTKGLYAKR